MESLVFSLISFPILVQLPSVLELNETIIAFNLNILSPTNPDLPALHILLKLADIGLLQFFR